MAEEIGLHAQVSALPSQDALLPTVRRLIDAGTERIAIAGGDGTVSLAVQEMAHTGTILGILPQGTFNNFATALHLPLSLPEALRVLKDGAVREVSLGKVEAQQSQMQQARYFTEASGIGLFADALALYGAGSGKNIWRGLSVVARLAFSLQAHRVRLILDGEAQPDQRLAMCTAANAYRMSYGVAVAPEARLTDDVLDVVSVGDLTVRELLPYFRAMRAQTHLTLPKVATTQAREIRIESRRRLNVHCDDQVVGTTPATITLQPRALKVLVSAL